MHQGLDTQIYPRQHTFIERQQKKTSPFASVSNELYTPHDAPKLMASQFVESRLGTFVEYPVHRLVYIVYIIAHHKQASPHLLQDTHSYYDLRMLRTISAEPVTRLSSSCANHTDALAESVPLSSSKYRPKSPHREPCSPRRFSCPAAVHIRHPAVCQRSAGGLAAA